MENGKAKGGRKSAWDVRIQPRLKEIAGWCRDGFTDKQISQKLGVAESTFLKYKAFKTELINALKINKYVADLNVENCLYKRAIGYEYTEETTEYYLNGKKLRDGDDKAKPDKVHKKKIKKFMPPDVTAQIFWLKNREPDRWRDKKRMELTGVDEEPIEIRKIDKDMDPKEAAKIYADMLNNQ